MEARAMYNFDASQQDELSFRRGDVLVIRNMEDKDWYQAQLGTKTGYVPATYVELEKNEWYKGKMSRAEAEMFLMKTNSQGHHVYSDGTFIVRDCESDRNQFSLSVKHGSCPQHFKILSNQDGQYYLWPHKYFTSINDLINYHRTNSVARDSRTVILLKDLQEANNANDKKKGGPNKPQVGTQMFEAEHDFHPEAPEEVGFRRGDKIILIEKTDENWWTGQVQSTGEQGLFPRNYVREVKN